MTHRIWSTARYATARWPRLALALLLTLGVLAALPPTPARAATHTVTTGADNVDGSLRAAIAAAAAGDTIVFAAGVTTVTLTGGTLAIAKNLTIQGTGTGGVRLEAGCLCRVFFINSGANVTMEGLTITKGEALTATQLHDRYGGGIYNDGGTLTLTDSIVTENYAEGLGGGIYNLGTLTLVRSTISDNPATFEGGGGIFNAGGMTLTESIVSGNDANGPAAKGGGIFNRGILTLTASTVRNNRASRFGGGLYNEGGAVTLLGTTVSDNDTADTNPQDGIDDRGGGLYNESGIISLTESTVSGNFAYLSSGGLYNGDRMTLTGSTVSDNTTTLFGGGIFNSGALTVTGSTISGNTAYRDAGGIFNRGSLTLSESTVSHNVTSGDGGGLQNLGGTAQLTNATFSGNVGGVDNVGSGIDNQNGTLTLTNGTVAGNRGGFLAIRNFGGTLTLTNTIVAGNAPWNCGPSVSNGGHNLDDGTSCGFGTANGSLSGVNPLLGPLANNGGPTATHALLPGSPAIDRVPASGAGCPAADQRGVARPQGAACDSGAVELVDAVAPQTVATASPAPPAGSPWNTTSVTVSLRATDDLSGVAATYYKLDGGAQQSGTSVTISADGTHTLQFWSVDRAGNVEAAQSIQVKVDKTLPTISHTLAPAANGNGWNNGTVTVTFTCADAPSGLASCTAPRTVTAEGANQAVTGTAVDNAGNTATDPATVNIDTTAPTIGAAADRAPNGAGWYSADVTVTFTCGDALSGIGTCPAPTILGEGANQTASGTAVDKAGNTASTALAGINVDKTGPTLTYSLAGPAASNGWYTGDVTVTWACADALSGVAGACPAASVIAGEGEPPPVSATVCDQVGNCTTVQTDGIKIDRAAPTIAGSRTPAASSAGWNNGPVTVSFACADAVSGIASCTGATTLETEGAGQSVVGHAVDNAGNTASATVANINIDRTPPTIALSGLKEVYTLGEAINLTCAATDGLAGAGPNGCTITASGGTANGVGTFTFTASATDNAGNTATQTGSYRVIYRFDGFLQPIDDPANPECGAGCTPSVFKAGGMVPVRFELQRADGTVVQANSLPVWLTPVQGGPTTAAVDEGSYSDPATSGSTYEQHGQQYHYKWSTKGAAAGYFYRLGVTLDDGQTYYVTIALR